MVARSANGIADVRRPETRFRPAWAGALFTLARGGEKRHMTHDNEGNSLFSKDEKALIPRVGGADGPVNKPGTPPQPSEAVQRVNDGRFAAFEAVVRGLKEELRALKGAPHAGSPDQDDGRVAALEAVVSDLREELRALKDAVPASPQQASDSRVEELAAVVRGLKRELKALRDIPPPSPLPAPPPAASAEELAERLERVEGSIAGLRSELSVQRDITAAYLLQSASKDALKTAGLKISDLMSSVEELKRSFALQGELALRLGRSENIMTELKARIIEQQELFNGGLAGLAQKEALNALRMEFYGLAAAVEALKKSLSEYSGEFDRIESECRRSLGEMQGHSRNLEQKLAGEGFNDYLKDSVSRLNSRLAELEKGMYATLADMSGRLTTGEVLSKKIFAEAEDRVKKGVEPGMMRVEGQINWLRDNVVWLKDEAKAAMERRIRALEEKCAVFEEISKRVHTDPPAVDD
jgi:hypothetical protein